MPRTTSELRQCFLDYFAQRGHQQVASSPLVPGNDPTLLFTNAGMVQFKDVFLGLEQRDYSRAASSQRCVRAGGKHNDLENVGYTARHHTFFEMLGNFSFGDYFKEDAIKFAWEFITAELGLPAERLWITVYQDDDEAAAIWLDDIGVDPTRFSRLGEKDNFWSMGETGPCGPCSEIFYDHGAQVPGGPPGSPDDDGDRYVEIWNLVFMQFERSAGGELTPLPKPSVDTGMGLERIAAVMQGVHSNYEIDLFANLIRDVASVTGSPSVDQPSLRVIADHIRACAFLIADGVLPGNEGRGYVLRRIIRRALRHGYELGTNEPFFFRLVEPLAREMAAAYPQLAESRAHIERVLRAEEERFAETLAQGMKILEEAFPPAGGTLSGDLVFKLYDTYGFPVDLTADIARARDVFVDREGFEQSMQAQRSRARAAAKFSAHADGRSRVAGQSEFVGYDQLTGSGTVIAMLGGQEPLDRLTPGVEQAAVVLDRTPFYAESGGQVGDRGLLRNEQGLLFRVDDVVRDGDVHVHLGECEAGSLAIGDTVTAEVDGPTRQATTLNHTATHLLHAALREILGSHVTQKGSLVAPDRLRFDFSHYEAVSEAELHGIENLVNAKIRENQRADTSLMSYDAAIESGAMALFGEKYGNEVRVLQIGDFSTELCGGTHVNRAGDIGLFKITTESGIAAGVRRIEAVTGAVALAELAKSDELLGRIAGLLKSGRGDVEQRLSQALARAKELEKENQRLKAELAGDGASNGGTVETVAGVQVLVNRLGDGMDAKTLRDAVDRLKSELRSGVVVLGSASGDGKALLVAGSTKDLTDRLPAGALVKAIAGHVGGRGGGRADFAQAGGNRPEGLDQALAAVGPWVSDQLG